MQPSRSIRTRVLGLTLGIVIVTIGGTGLLTVRLLGAAAESAVERDIQRTAGLLAQAGFFGSPDVMDRVARFLGADVATVLPDGSIESSNLRAPRLYELENLLLGLPDHGERGERVLEVDLAGAPVTIGLAPGPQRGEHGISIALVYPGRLITARRLATIAPIGAVALAGLVLAALAGLLLARSVVRPIEELARSAGRIAAGELDARLDVRSGDEVEALAHSLATMVGGLRDAQIKLDRAEKLTALGRLTTALAHEIKNPLTSIRMTLEIELERLSAGRERDALRMVLREVELLSLFAARLLAFARGPAVHPRAAPIAPVVADVLALLGAQLEHLGIRVETDIPADAPLAHIDPEALRQVVLNLLLNAAEAMPGGGRVLVRVARAGERVRLSVEDEGSGIAESHAARIFEPFFSSKEGGTGLGLANSKTIVEALGGVIRWRAREGGGTVFEVEVKVAAERAGERKDG